MASSRKRNRAELQEEVAAALARELAPGAAVVIGLSGGVDSVTLLAILRELAPRMRFSLRAIHVNHGLSPHAQRWERFCAALCERWGVPLAVERVDVRPHRGLGVEGAARAARYAVFARTAADCLVLAHHRDDQAETLLLQLLRGTGIRGLAGMPPARALAGAAPRLLRPLLNVSRARIEAWARERGLEWIEDESNSDSARRRSFLRCEVLPLLEQRFPSARAAIARAAQHLAEASQLLDDLARADLAVVGGEPVSIARLAELSAARAKNLLRYLCESRGIAAPGAARLAELLRQLTRARSDAEVSVAVGGFRFRRYRGVLYLERESQAPDRGLRFAWSGENSLPLLDLGGVLRFKPEEGRGLSVARLKDAPVTVRLRQGGERLRPDCRRPRRKLKRLFQEKGVPPWQRGRLPLLYCGERLVWAPGIGEECEFQARPDEAGLIVSWERL